MTIQDKNVAVFDRDVSSHGGYVYTTNQSLSSRWATQTSTEAVLRAHQFTGRAVLDMGCGDGYYTIKYWDAAHPRSMTGVDGAPKAIEAAADHKGARPMEFLVGDFHHLPFPDNSFDVVLVQSVMHHDDDPQDMIREAFRLAPTIVIHDPNGNNLGLKVIEKVSRYHREHGERSYSSRQMRLWIEAAGGRVVDHRFDGFVAMFSPDWIARTMKVLEPVVENVPGVNLLGCAVQTIVATRA